MVSLLIHGTVLWLKESALPTELSTTDNLEKVYDVIFDHLSLHWAWIVQSFISINLLYFVIDLDALWESPINDVTWFLTPTTLTLCHKSESPKIWCHTQHTPPAHPLGLVDIERNCITLKNVFFGSILGFVFSWWPLSL
jgi:hypothetical protein